MPKVAAAILIACLIAGATFSIITAIRADARADIANYLTGFGYKAPNAFEPGRHDILGTASEIVANRTANWTVFRNMGNLGIGNGSTATFGDPNSLPSNYTDYYFQAGDVSQEPLDPARELNLNPATPIAAAEPGNVSAGNETAAPPGNSSHFPEAAAGQNFSDIRNRQAFNDSILPAVANASQPSSENATGPAAAGTVPSFATPENMTYAAYHPINAGRPVNDLLYEHPFATSISTYCRLVGLATPAGPPINIGMRCLSYGY